ncbi:MAG: hypothetical protein IIY52_02120 [Solobacterium sp.]|nr:hypothetical protein [Solobacterium sp.]MBQ1446387.1 hypothetical protein [Solobacterium sp.]
MKIIRIVIGVLLVLCTGCTVVSSSLEQQTDAALEQTEKQQAARPNYDHLYYSYYLQPGIGRISSDETGNVFSFNGVKFTMNLNVRGIINSAYYTGAANETLSGKQLMKHEGKYRDADNIEHMYVLCLYRAGEQVYIDYEDDRVCMGACTDEGHVPDTAAAMLATAMSVRVDRVLVLDTFSHREMISSTRKKLDLFERISPESGVIDELLVNSDDQNPEPEKTPQAQFDE